MSQVNLAIMASGSGTNAENIINYFRSRSDVKISVIISNKADAYVHKRAEKLGVFSVTFSKSQLEDPVFFLDLLGKYKVDFIILAGYLLKIPDKVTVEYLNRIVNIHPALLPKFGGKGMYGSRVHEAVIESGEKYSGITVHFVNNNYDEGKIIFQAKCPVMEGDSPEMLASRVHSLEYEFYPKVIDDVLRKTFPEVVI